MPTCLERNECAIVPSPHGGSEPGSVSDFSSRACQTPAAPSPNRLACWINLPIGFAILVLSVVAGEQIKSRLHLPIPGNVLGLFVLVLCLRLRLIQPELIEEAASRLLYLLPAFFIPLFVSAIGWDQLWSKVGWIFLPTLLAATASLWVFVGHLGQHVLCRALEHE